MVEGAGFEPTKGEARQIYSLLHLATLQSLLNTIGGEHTFTECICQQIYWSVRHKTLYTTAFFYG